MNIPVVIAPLPARVAALSGTLDSTEALAASLYTLIDIMKTTKANAGLWIDHREAIIVKLMDQGFEIKRIQSAAEKQLRREGEPDHGPFESQLVPADDSRQREYSGQLARYYDAIVSSLQDSGSILIFGPGETKGELKKRFEKHPVGQRLITLETTDKMTEAQIVARVQQHFQADPVEP